MDQDNLTSILRVTSLIESEQLLLPKGDQNIISPYSVTKTRDENMENHQIGDILIEREILRVNIEGIVWQSLRRIFLFIRWMELLAHAIKAEEIDEEQLGRPHSDTVE